jgi:hypothetical protein
MADPSLDLAIEATFATWSRLLHGLSLEFLHD